MPRIALTMLGLAFLAPALAAAEPRADALKNEQQYIDRLLAMPDTAPAHADLATWCAANGMDERAKVHWREALARDPDNKEARAALGFVKRGIEWVPAEKAGPTPLPPPPPDETFLARRRELRQQILDISRELLVPGDMDRWKQGQLKILMIRDPATAEPIIRILGVGPIESRMLAADVLAQTPGDEALRYLLGLAVADPSDAVHKAAVDALELRDDHRVIQQLIYACARGLEPTMRRAAHALGELRAWEAVPALIANLRTVEYRTVLVKELRRPNAIMGMVIPYVADLRPVVAPGVVAYDPVIGTITPGGIGVYARPVEVTTRKTEAKLIEQPVVLEALKKITGQDLGYDDSIWRRWLASEERRRAEKEKAAKDGPKS